MKNLQYSNLKKIDVWRVVCASESTPFYDGSKLILIDAGERYPSGESFILLDGYHCSCYGWEETAFDCTSYSREELRELANATLKRDYLDDYERLFWASVKLAVEEWRY